MAIDLFKCKKRKGTLLVKSIFFIVFLLIVLCLVYNLQIVPLLIPLVESKVTSDVTANIQQQIANCISSHAPQNIISIQYNQNGDVVSLETNMAYVSKLTSLITQNTISALESNEKFSVNIPIGNLTGGTIFSGKGPNINIKVLVSPKISCKLENEFYESGINQTLHKIYAVTQVDVYALIPLNTTKIEISSDFCISETVIVGRVPQAYTKINRAGEDISESDIDDIYDFGATLQ